MTTVLMFFGGIIQGIRALGGLVFPIFADAADFRSWPGWLRVLIGFALIVGLCVGIYYIQQAIPYFDRHLPTLQTLKPYFLVILFILLVIFSWLAYWLWMLLTAEDEEAEFPDIREEWEEAVKRMTSAGLGVGDAPLFLVLGRPAAGLDSLFLAAGVKDIIRTPSLGAGGKGDPSIRVYAWEEAIFVVCPGASAWARFCVELTNPADTFQNPGASPAGTPVGATLPPGAVFAGMDPVSRAEMESLISEASRRDLTYEEQTRLRDLYEQSNAVTVTLRKAVILGDDERARLTRRLRYLCKLIRRDRQPWCPINGVLTVIPWSATDGNDLINVGSGLLETELSAARNVFQLRYPTFAIVSDLETNRGFVEFRSGFRPEMLKARIGQRFPLVPVGKPEEIANLVAGVARWIGLSVLPRWILEFLRFDTGDNPRRTTEQANHNRNLYMLMRAVFDRGPRLAELLSRGLPAVGGYDDLATVPMFGGCYLAATGQKEQEQAFVEGVFKRVIESQSAVSWSPEALAADARLKRFAWFGYIAVVAFAIAAGVAVYIMLTPKLPGT